MSVYVNVYELDRNYGGSEEGGWWFDSGEPELSITCESQEHAESVRDLLETLYVDHGNRYSVIYWRKERDYAVWIEDAPACAFPVESPHYE